MPGNRCSRMDRRKFETDLLTYEWIKYSLFISKQYVFIPRFSSTAFTRFWSKIVINETKCLIVDGTWKLRRAICSNKLVYRCGLAFDLIETGCPNSRMLI